MSRKKPTAPWRATHLVTRWRDGHESKTHDVQFDGRIGATASGVPLVERRDDDWHWIGPWPVSRFRVTARAGVKPRAGVRASKRITVNLTPERMTLVEAAAKREGLSLSQWADGAIDLALARGSTR